MSKALTLLCFYNLEAIWNLFGLAWTEEKRPDLIDIPSRME